MPKNDYAPEVRKAVIGGSDASTIMGVNPWSNQMQLYMDKLGMSDKRPDNLAMMVGRELEGLVATLYKDYQFPSVDIQLVTPKEMVHPKYPWMIGHIDRLVYYPDNVLSHGLECKTTGILTRNDWGEEGTDQIPKHYICQVHHYLAVTGLEFFDVAVLIGNQEFRTYRVPRNDEFNELLIEKEYEFLQRILNQRPPEIDESEASAKFLARKFRFSSDEIIAVKTEDEAPELFANVQRLKEAHKAVKEWEAKESGAKNLIMAFMGEAKKLVAGDMSFSWVTAKESTIINWQEIAGLLKVKCGLNDEDFKALIGEHSKAKAQVRAFRPNWPKEE